MPGWRPGQRPTPWIKDLLTKWIGREIGFLYCRTKAAVPSELGRGAGSIWPVPLPVLRGTEVRLTDVASRAEAEKRRDA